MSEPAAVGPGNDMSADLKQNAIQLFEEAILKFSTEKEVAHHIHSAFTRKYPKWKWHCVVGRSFASFVGYEEKTHFTRQLGLFQLELWACA
jgi:dynein light chain LC8-type